MFDKCHEAVFVIWCTRARLMPNLRVMDARDMPEARSARIFCRRIDQASRLAGVCAPLLRMVNYILTGLGLQGHD